MTSKDKLMNLFGMSCTNIPKPQKFAGNYPSNVITLSLYILHFSSSPTKITV